VPIAACSVLFVPVILVDERRRVVLVAVTEHPTAPCTAQHSRMPSRPLAATAIGRPRTQHNQRVVQQPSGRRCHRMIDEDEPFGMPKHCHTSVAPAPSRSSLITRIAEDSSSDCI
jgi:hypothetical protein